MIYFCDREENKSKNMLPPEKLVTNKFFPGCALYVPYKNARTVTTLPHIK